MKTLYIILLVLFVLPQAWADDQISVEQFKQLTLPEQEKILNQSPSEIKPELRKVYEHIYVLAQFGGETRFRNQKEVRIVRARGFTCLEMLCDEYMTFWSAYMGRVMVLNEKAGMPLAQQQKAEIELRKEEDVVRRRVSNVHSLVYTLAPTPAALELEKRAEILNDKLLKRLTGDVSTPYRPITIEERKDADKQIAEIYSKLQTLPKLTPDQMQKEYDAFTDEQFMQEGGIAGGVGAGSE